MVGYLVGRGIRIFLSFFAITTIVFVALRFAPGDPAMLIGGDGVGPEQIALVRHEFGLDRPILLQYGEFLSELFQGRLGRSLTGRVPVVALISKALPKTLLLAFSAWILSTAIALSLGLYAASHRNSVGDLIAVGIAGIGRGLPDFWVAIMLLMVFAVRLRWLPVLGGSITHMILPTITISIQVISLTLRIVRDSLLEVLGMDYIRTARSKGLPERTVILKHAFRNALIPVVTVLGLRLASLIGAGMVVTETIFNWPGFGNLFLRSIQIQDYPTVQGCMIVVAGIFLVLNLAVDVIYVTIDPRVTYK